MLKGICLRKLAGIPWVSLLTSHSRPSDFFATCVSLASDQSHRGQPGPFLYPLLPIAIIEKIVPPEIR